jgi:hypothetical protein
LRTVFVSCPTSPELGKWTKFGPAVDHVLMGTLVFRILGAAFNLAFASGSTGNVAQATLADAEASFSEEKHWQAVKGVRAKTTVSLLTDRLSTSRIVCLAVASEPVRALLRVLLHYSSAEARKVGCAMRVKLEYNVYVSFW